MPFARLSAFIAALRLFAALLLFAAPLAAQQPAQAGAPAARRDSLATRPLSAGDREKFVGDCDVRLTQRGQRMNAFRRP